MTKQRILIVDDEPDLLWALDQRLSSHGYSVTLAEDGARALAILRRQAPDLIVLDINMPRMNGHELYQRIRRMRRLERVPILFLTVRNNVEERVRALNSGADAYLGKPFDLDELVARVRALLRRQEQRDAAGDTEQFMSVGRLYLDMQSRQVQIDGRTARLTAAEVDLLRCFMERPDVVITADELLQALHSAAGGGPGLVRWHIMNLRAKIEALPSQPAILQTVPRQGYLLASSALEAKEEST